MQPSSTPTTAGAHDAPALRCPLCGDRRVAICARACPENLQLTGRLYSYGHCPGCGVISLLPPPHSHQLGHYYRLPDQRQQSWLHSPGSSVCCAGSGLAPELLCVAEIEDQPGGCGS